MVNIPASYVKQIYIKHFRCFQEKTVTLNAPLILLQGINGVGKTSLLEALYYACYLKSFRASTPRDLISDHSSTFFIKILVQGEDKTLNELSVGFSRNKRLVKINESIVSSYKDLLEQYKVIVVTEDDLDLVKEGPSARREFLDHALMLCDLSSIQLLKQVKTTLEKRNALLHHGSCAPDLYDVWTRLLWDYSHQLQKKRAEFLQELQNHVNALIETYFNADFSVTFTYNLKKGSLNDLYESFREAQDSLYQDELRYRRSLFGSHLDDILIQFKGKNSRIFASRGQQKLIVILIKAAHIRMMRGNNSVSSIIMLLDDFMTDFDESRFSTLITLLKDLQVQLIFTSPCAGGPFENIFRSQGAHIISLNSLD